MKAVLFIFFSVFAIHGFSQQNVAVSNTRLVAGCMLNDSSFAVSASNVKVEVNPRTGEIFAEFNNTDARDMTSNAEMYYSNREFTFYWVATISGLEEMLKNGTVQTQQKQGSVLITIGNNSIELPVMLTLEHMSGTTGVTKMATLSGVFDPNYFEMNTEKFQWDEEFTYSINFRSTMY